MSFQNRLASTSGSIARDYLKNIIEHSWQNGKFIDTRCDLVNITWYFNSHMYLEICKKSSFGLIYYAQRCKVEDKTPTEIAMNFT